MNLLVPILLLACFSAQNVVVASTKSSAMDFSYLHRVKSSMLGDAIRQNIFSVLEDEKSDDDIIIDIDVSSSMIGKDVKDLVSSLENSYPAPVSIQLTARANQWTMDDATLLLQSIVETTSGSEKEAQDDTASTSLPAESEGNETAIESNETAIESSETEIESNETAVEFNETEVESSETEIDSNTTISMDDNQTTATTEDAVSFNISIQSLDLGWNNFGQGSASRRSKAFLKSLQKTIESKTCPQILRFPVCGLGPGACRAIGKVGYSARGA
jgi:hypothetical protein